ncbi:MAG: choice-of-anchor Q domain-containing protein, partial [Roseibacillus sp.]
GGGISNFGTLTLHHSTLAHNSTGDGGDGDGGNGGGIFNEKKLTLHNSTISQNSARDGGGGVFNDTNDTLTLHSSLIAQNTATGFGPDISQRGNYGTNSGVNFIGDPTNAGTIPGTQGTDYLTGNALLAPLANYGGPTQTMRPLFGSPTIDAGGSTNPGGTDQRGFNRFVNEMLDIGAVEYNPATDEPPVITAFTKAPGFHPTTNPIFNVTFTTIPGLDYTLEHNSTLQGTFTPLGPALEATAPTMTLQVPLDPTQDFLRARRE